MEEEESGLKGKNGVCGSIEVEWNKWFEELARIRKVCVCQVI